MIERHDGSSDIGRYIDRDPAVQISKGLWLVAAIANTICGVAMGAERIARFSGRVRRVFTPTRIELP